MIPKWYPDGFDFSAIGMKAFGKVELSAVVGIWSVELVLIIGIIINAFIILETSSNWISSWIEYKYWWSATCNNEYRRGVWIWWCYCSTSRLCNYER